MRGLPVAGASVVEHSSRAHGRQQLRHEGSQVVTPGLLSTRLVTKVQRLSCSVGCGIFPDQGSNPFPCIGRWTPLSHQGSPDYVS